MTFARADLSFAILGGLCLICASCFRPSENNAGLDETVGELADRTTELSVFGQGVAEQQSPSQIRVWAASPTLRLALRNNEPLTLLIENVLPTAQLRSSEAVFERVGPQVGTRATFEIPAGDRLLDLASPDAGIAEPYSFAVLSDIQEALPEVGDIIERLNLDDDIRFVVSAGDITNRGETEEYLMFRDSLEQLQVPFFATPGNHELPNPEHWNQYFGPFSTFFEFKGVAFSLLDSSNATVDPLARQRFDEFLFLYQDDAHLLFTHVPFLDPSGFRSLAFRSRNEAASVTADVIAGGVDGMFFGHIHAYAAFSHGGIAAYVSGGGGATREARDGIFRHYLRVNVQPGSSPIESVALVRVD